jgi:hypothetical protein
MRFSDLKPGDIFRDADDDIAIKVEEYKGINAILVQPGKPFTYLRNDEVIHYEYAILVLDP